MDCGVGSTRLSSLLDGELESADAEALRTHVGVCRRCGQIYAAYQQDLALLQAFVATAPWRPVEGLDRLTRRPSALRRGLRITAHGLAGVAQVSIVFAVLAALALVLRTLNPELPRTTRVGQTEADPAFVVDAFLAARADHDVARVRALFDDQAVVNLNGQPIQVRTLHTDAELRHWLVLETWQFTYTGPRTVVGDQVTWHEHAVLDTPRLPGVPPTELDEDVAAVVRAGKITSLTYTVSPPSASEADPTVLRKERV
jgi:ketosteroid isomerase-like protein